MDLVDILFYMRKTHFTKLASIVALVTCLVCAILFTEFVSAGQFREPTNEDVESQQFIEPVGTPQVSEPPLEDLIHGVDQENSFWQKTYPWDVALSAIIFIAAVVFAILFGMVQKLFGV